ncbi:transposase (plasmid) [Polymorphobacter sp. PAMC 29334]|nr:transposase [Polymorphobacter sp. PAMC 29334]
MFDLALQVHFWLSRDPDTGDLYIFRDRRGDRVKVLWHDGVDLSLHVKRLDHGASSGRRRTTASWDHSVADGVSALSDRLA